MADRSPRARGLKDTVLLIAAGILLNILLAKVPGLIGAPLFLDSVGTILVAALGGYMPGIVVGVASNAINSIADPITIYYSAISVYIALLSTYFSQRGMFSKLRTAMAGALLLALVGGGLGSLLTWSLSGFAVGSGISTPYADALIDAGGFDPFPAQLLADLGIDVLDKLATMLIVLALLRTMPARLRDRFALGSACAPGSHVERRPMHRMHRHPSLASQLAAFVVIAAALIGTTAVIMSDYIYRDNLKAAYVRTGDGLLDTASSIVDPDLVDDFLSLDLASPDNVGIKEAYDAELEQLQRINDDMQDVAFLYVYQIREDGCHVVFDTDTPEFAGDALGDVQEFDEEFSSKLSALLAGEDIPPVESDDEFGWLYTQYQPLYDSEGTCVAYCAIDYSMYSLIGASSSFTVRIAALLTAIASIVAAIAVWLANRRVVQPIDGLADATQAFVSGDEDRRRQGVQAIEQLDITGHDEIENLYLSITKMTNDMTAYLSEIEEKDDEIQDELAIIKRMQKNTIMSFAVLVESRDQNTGRHVQRTAAYVHILGEAMLAHDDYPEMLDRDYLDRVVESAPLHDVGKIKIPDAILNKPGRLTDEEFEVIKTHTTAGAKALAAMATGIPGKSYLSMADDLALYHHERWDGTGYPTGLSGTDIPLCARIMAVSDVLDALLSKRSYKEPMSFEQATAIIDDGAGTQFDPKVVAAFDRCSDQLERAWHAFPADEVER